MKQQRLKFKLLALILFGCSAAAYLLDTRISESTYAYVGKHTSGVGQLTENAVTQTFTATENHLAAVEVMYSNYNKKPQSGTLTLWLLDSEGLELRRPTRWPSCGTMPSFVCP